MIFKFIPGFYMGWGLGANDAANVFGPQVHSGIISYKKAVLLTSFFIILGALLEGEKCFAQIGHLTSSVNSTEIFIATLSGAIMIHIMSVLKLPASTSHAIVGSLVGSGIAFGSTVDYGRVTKSIVCWVATPIGAALISIALYYVLKVLMSRAIRNIATYNSVITIVSVIIGCYGAYALGANNLANVVGPYVGAGLMGSLTARILGGFFIAFGVITYSKNVMETVGKGITALDPFSALVTILGASLVLHIFSQLGIPVSSSQAVVGAVLGVGTVKGLKTVRADRIFKIFAGWVMTLVGTIIFSGLMAMAYKAF